MIRVKICGITNPQDAYHAAQAGADAIGLVFCESPRRVDIAQAKDIIRALPPFAAAVGLFVNEDPHVVIDTARQLSLTAVQLHGDESPDEVAAVARYCRVIKAIRVRGPVDIAEAEAYSAHVAAYLFDAYVPGVAGGTGHCFNWDLLPKAGETPLSRPVILAGGLSVDNVRQAIEGRDLYGVDVSSGVERAKGIKDKDKITQFIARVRR